ncbi:unnamed protein product [Chironomus riparius]|uniref:F-box domain-containing protein n=1 Tax=Chironomus riparius TaxID=315576 RepID=A0A9N9S5R1_9DIPT|nr:unnamed protein product [Chironomus riparius]
MNHLPEELIINILSFNDPADLVALSLTCKLFSKIVNNNCDRLAATFDRYTQKLDWIGSRKYKKILISTHGIEKFKEIGGKIAITEIDEVGTSAVNSGTSNSFPEKSKNILQTFGDHVETLTIAKCEITLENLDIILNLCKNLKNFNIEVSKIKNFDEKIKNLPTFNLKKLSISQDEENELQALKLFTKCEVKELTLFTDIEVRHAEVQEIIKFLQSRNSLEMLKINFEKFVFPIIFENVYFPLKNLTIAKSELDGSENAENFLSLFCDSLEFLEIDDFGDKIARILKNFLKLTKLSLNLDRKRAALDFSVIPDYDYLYYRQLIDITPLPVKYINALPQVEFLTTTNICNNIVPYFPNLKKLIIHKNVCFVNLEPFTQLEFLDINICQCCKQFKIPKCLKYLKITTENFSRDLPPFCFDETSLEELTLEGFGKLNWIKELLNDEKLNLKLLRIKGSQIDEECRIILNTLPVTLVELQSSMMEKTIF